MREFEIHPFNNSTKRIIVTGPDYLTFYVDHDDVDIGLVDKQLPYIVETLNANCLLELKAISDRHYQENKKKFEIAELLEEALETDGEHHKQWYLEQLVEKLDVDIYMGRYESGIAP